MKRQLEFDADIEAVFIKIEQLGKLHGQGKIAEAMGLKPGNFRAQFSVFRKKKEVSDFFLRRLRDVIAVFENIDEERQVGNISTILKKLAALGSQDLVELFCCYTIDLGKFGEKKALKILSIKLG